MATLTTGQYARREDLLESPSTSGHLRTTHNSSADNGKHTEAGFRDRYNLGRLLGCGTFSNVRVAIDRATGQAWACKTVTEQAERALLLREVDILQQLQHPNLLKYREHFNTPDTLYIITELLDGSDLLAFVLEHGCLSEEEARDILRQMLSALSYLSALGVAHRDLKMENIMLLREADDVMRVKIIDFGLADQLSEGKLSFDEACGTPTYLAPEVASRTRYGTGCDVWSAGVVLFVMLSGEPPFQGKTVGDLILKIRQAKLQFKEPVWKVISAGAKHFVSTLMTANPAHRITAEEALKHAWVTSWSDTLEAVL